MSVFFDHSYWDFRDEQDTKISSSQRVDNLSAHPHSLLLDLRLIRFPKGIKREIRCSVNESGAIPVAVNPALGQR
jgi:hypothetical protein